MDANLPRTRIYVPLFLKQKLYKNTLKTLLYHWLFNSCLCAPSYNIINILHENTKNIIYLLLYLYGQGLKNN